MSCSTHFKPKKRILVCSILSVLPIIAYAETTDTMEVVGSMAKTGTVKFYDTQSTDSIDEKQIKDKDYKKVDEALSYTSGVLNSSYGHDGRTNWLKIRGLDVSFTLDGMPQFTYSYFGSTPEIFGLEKIEVLKGASSQLYGSSKPGGTVNMISKRPKKAPAGEVNVFYGTHAQVGINGDYSGILTDDVRYRLVGAYRDENGQQTKTGLKHYYFAPSLTWDINELTSLTLLSSFQRDFGIPENGFFPAYGTLFHSKYGKVARDTYYGDKDFDNFNRKSETVGYEFRHQFNNGLVFTQNYKYAHQDLDLSGVYGMDFTPTVDGKNYSRFAYSQIGINNTHTIDNRLSKDFEYGNWRDTLLIGIDYLNTNMSGNNFSGSASTVNRFKPRLTHSNITGSYSPFKLKAQELGAYVQNQLTFDNKLIFNQGIRHSKIKNDGYWSGSDFNRDYNHNAYNAGLMYIFDNNIAPYINYSESFLPVYGYDSVNKTMYRPYEAKQWEVGGKYEPDWLNGTFTLAYFDIKSQNSFVSNGTGQASQTLEARSKGVELQIKADITKSIDMDFAYTYTHAKTDQTASLTTRSSLIPKHSASAWVNYKFDGQLDGLTVGSGLRYIGKTVDEVYYPNESVPSYTLWDAMVKYQFNKSWSVQVNATNLTDKKYVSGCSYWCYYGAERSVVGTLNYKW